MRKGRGPTRKNLTEKEKKDKEKLSAKYRQERKELMDKGICTYCRTNPIPKDSVNVYYCAECRQKILRRRQELIWSRKMAKDLGFDIGDSDKAQRMIDERINPTFIGKAPISKKMMSETVPKVRIVWGREIPDVEEQVNQILERGITAEVIDVKFFETKSTFVACVIIKEYCGVKSKI